MCVCVSIFVDENLFWETSILDRSDFSDNHVWYLYRLMFDGFPTFIFYFLFYSIHFWIYNFLIVIFNHIFLMI